MKGRQLVFILCLCSMSMIISCDSKLGKTFTGMFEIQEAVGKIAGTSSVSVSIVNSENMTIRLNNSPLNGVDHEARSQSASEIAKEAIRVYEYGNAIKKITVVFVLVDTKFFVMSTSQTVDEFSYDSNDIKSMSSDKALQMEYSRLATLAFYGH